MITIILNLQLGVDIVLIFRRECTIRVSNRVWVLTAIKM